MEPGCNTYLAWAIEDSLSYRIAEIFYRWLPTLVPGCVPFFSEEMSTDQPQYQNIIDSSIACKILVVFLTSEAMNRPWLNFEGGLFASQRKGVSVLLIDLDYKSTINSPFFHFNPKSLKKTNILKVLRDINNKLIDNKNTYASIKERLDANWANIENEIEEIKKFPSAISKPAFPITLFIKKGTPQLLEKNGKFENGLWLYTKKNDADHSIWGPPIELQRGGYFARFYIKLKYKKTEGVSDSPIVEIDVAKKQLDSEWGTIDFSQLTDDDLITQRDEKLTLTFNIKEDSEKVQFRVKLLAGLLNPLVFNNVIIQRLV
jgi:hypothetical protein